MNLTNPVMATTTRVSGSKLSTTIHLKLNSTEARRWKLATAAHKVTAETRNRADRGLGSKDSGSQDRTSRLLWDTPSRLLWDTPNPGIPGMGRSREDSGRSLRTAASTSPRTVLGSRRCLSSGLEDRLVGHLPSTRTVLEPREVRGTIPSKVGGISSRPAGLVNLKLAASTTSSLDSLTRRGLVDSGLRNRRLRKNHKLLTRATVHPPLNNTVPIRGPLNRWI